MHYLQLESPCSKSQELGAVLLLHGSEQKPQTEANVVPLAVEVAALLYQGLCTRKPKSYHAANRKMALRAQAADSHWNSSTASPSPATSSHTSYTTAATSSGLALESTTEVSPVILHSPI